MTALKRLFIIEDNSSLRHELTSLLSLQNYLVAHCTNYIQAAHQALSFDPHLVILDLRLPETDGLAICKEIREHSQVPCLILTSSDTEFDEVMSLRLGADSFLTKPYSPAVLLAHIERLLQRNAEEPAQNPSWNGVELSLAYSLAYFEGKSVELSKNEIRILSILMKAQGAIVSRYDLMYELWQSDEFVDDNTLTVNVNRLRKSLASLGCPANYLKTHRGQGYSL